MIDFLPSYRALFIHMSFLFILDCVLSSGVLLFFIIFFYYIKIYYSVWQILRYVVQAMGGVGSEPSIVDVIDFNVYSKHTISLLLTFNMYIIQLSSSAATKVAVSLLLVEHLRPFNFPCSLPFKTIKFHSQSRYTTHKLMLPPPLIHCPSHHYQPPYLERYH